MRAPSFLTAAAVLAVAVAACREPPGPGEVLLVEIAAGDGQTDTVGQQLPQPIAVRVNDANGRLVYGLTVVFSVTAGGGSVAPDTVTTSGSGVAQTRWTLGTSTADSQRVSATVVDPRSSEVVGEVTFRATARPDRPISLAKRQGDGQTGPLGAPLSQQLAVQVLDRYGNGVLGLSVRWTLDTAGGSINPTNSSTDGVGIARATWTLGLTLDTTYRVTASVSGLSFVTFGAVPQLPTSVILEVLGDSQSGMVNASLAESVGVRVEIETANITFYVRNALLTFAVTAGGGSITPAQVRTNQYGEARANWVLGSAVGTNTATATVAPGMARLTALGVLPVLVALVDSQVAVVGTSLGESLAVQVEVPQRGGGSVGVPGAVVPFTVTSGGGTITPSQVTTDGGGVARANWVLGATPGTNTATATFAAQTLTLTAQGFQPVGAAAIAAGSLHSCAVTINGVAYCWGDNTYGQLGDGTSTARLTPVAVAGGGTFATVAGGTGHTCGLDAGGLAYCWGDNTFGQVGDGTRTGRLVPTAVAGGPPFVSLALGRLHSCGLTSAGAAYCWGDNTFGQVGDSSTTARTFPVAVAGGRPFTRLTAGDDHTCGLEAGGDIYCWGVNYSGQLGAPTAEACTYTVPGGINTVTCSRAPLRVSTTLRFTDLASRYSHACGLTSVGSVYCWGEGSVSLEPVPSAPAFSRLANGTTCALTAAGAAYCWEVYTDYYYGGRVVSGAAAVSGAVSFSLLVGRAGHSCALRAGAQPYAYCWGQNNAGQLGDGTVRWRYTPAPVVLVGL